MFHPLKNGIEKFLFFFVKVTVSGSFIAYYVQITEEEPL